MIPSTLVRLKNIASINDDQLDENTSPDFVFEYVDVGSVGRGFLVDEPEKIRFGEAPSRARRLVRVGDTIVSTVRTYLRAILPITPGLDDVVVSTGFAVVRPRPTVDHGFLSWALQADPFVEEVVARSAGVSYPAIAPSAMADIKLTVPIARQDQRLIADFLDRETERIDALVDAKRRMIDLLEEKRAVTIEETMSKAPGSVTMRLKHLLSEPLTYGANEAASQSMEGDPRYIRTTDIDGRGILRDHDVKTLSWESARPYLLREGDILLTRSGATVGKSFLYSSDLGPACHAGYLVRLRPNKQIVSPRYLRYFTDSASYWRQVAESSIQATIQNVSAARYGEFLIPVPHRHAQGQIMRELDRRIGAIDLAIDRLTHQLALLAEYRQALITMAVTGQLDEATLKGKKPADEVFEV